MVLFGWSGVDDDEFAAKDGFRSALERMLSRLLIIIIIPI